MAGKGVENITKQLFDQTESVVSVLSEALLTIYDQVIISDSKGTIIENFGMIDDLWGEQSIQKGKIIFEADKKTFFGETSMSELVKGAHRSVILTAWNNKKVMATCLRKMKTDGAIVWGLKDITVSQLPYPEETIEQEKIEENRSVTFIAKGAKMQQVLNTVEMVAKVSASVLLLGESGVGKEVIAKAIHTMGPRKNRPFIAVNCGAIPDNLLESELFGYVEGAFSGARKDGAPGKFELAHKGVLFLDEIGEMPLHLQVKLLRVLQEKEVTPLGSGTPKKIDVQIITATNKNLEDLVQQGKFREDLYYRLNVIPIKIPSLRERVEEIPHLAYYFLKKFNKLYGRSIQIEQDAMDLLSIYEWPGNVRQLENLIERIVVTSKNNTIDAAAIQSIIPFEKVAIKPPVFDHLMPLQEAVDLVEEQLITRAMEKYKSIKLAAKALQVSQPTMSRKYKKIQEKMVQANIPSSNRRKILENQLDNRLRSVALVTAAIIKPEEVEALKKDVSSTNPISQKLQATLTMIREQEGGIQWAFIFEMLGKSKFRTLAADKDFVMKPGDLYDSTAEFSEVAQNAVKGHVEVTPLYQDDFGEWKTSLAPVIDSSGKVIALIGYDYSKAYIESEIKKLGEVLKINI